MTVLPPYFRQGRNVNISSGPSEVFIPHDGTCLGKNKGAETGTTVTGDNSRVIGKTKEEQTIYFYTA